MTVSSASPSSRRHAIAAACDINNNNNTRHVPTTTSVTSRVSGALVGIAAHPCAFLLAVAVAILATADGPVLFAAAEVTTCNPARCSPGYYFSDCGAQCKVCEPGYYCRGNLTAPAPCPAGYHLPDEGAAKFDACKLCPTTAISSAGSPYCTQCPPLMYAPSGVCTHCPPGHITKNSECTRCPQGFFASNVTGICEACTAGFACPSQTHDLERGCTPGTYSNTGDGYCRPCEAGFACPTVTPFCTRFRSANRIACQPGTFSTANMTACQSCPAAHYCPDTRTAAQIPCPRGYYSLGGQFKCTKCPDGFKCDPAVADGAPAACELGEISDGLSCLPCPEGFQCPSTTAKFPCPAGSYSPSGQVTCTDCEQGSFCPSATAKSLCPPGTIGTKPGQTACEPCEQGSTAVYQIEWGATTCKPCPRGHYCPNPANAPIACPLGFISQTGKYRCTSCAVARKDVATYTPANASTACVICPVGHFCPETTLPPRQCPVGFTARQGSFLCDKCPVGHQCPDPAGYPEVCQPGYYALGGQHRCTRCPANAMCPFVNAGPMACDSVNGFYSAAGSTVCKSCPTGASCTISGGNLTFSTCAKGEYRDGVSCRPCPLGYYCPITTSPPIPCPIGMYSLQGSQACFTCPAGKQCPSQTRPLTCTLGFYSYDNHGVCLRCPRGFACPVPWAEPRPCGLGSFSVGQQTNCTVCPPGYECPSTQDFMALHCRPGTFSVGGSDKCTLCPAGHECPNTDNDFMRPCPTGYFSRAGQVNCTACPAGFACPSTNGDQVQPVPCKVGSYSNGMATACTPCEAGFACPYTSTSIRYACHAGSFTGPGEARCLQCAAGHYCPKTAVAESQPFFGDFPIGRQIRCKLGTFAPPGSTECTPCPAGYVCRSIHAADGERTLCPDGYMTIDIEGKYTTTGAVNCQACAIGVDCSVPGQAPTSCVAGQQATVAGCEPCPSGYACPSPTIDPVPCEVGTYANNASTECTACDGGYLCQTRSATPSPTAGGCPMGHYCPPGTKSAIMCPAGTFGRSIRAASREEGCITCISGYYCPAGSAGLGALVACPEGYYCPAGAAAPLPCPEGTYSTQRYAVSRATCLLCPPGHFCPTGCSQYAPNQCPPGFFCPAGTGHGLDNPCPAGTYAMDGKLYSATQCTVCPPGHFCPHPGLVSAIACPPGSYQGQRGSIACKDCDAGWACPEPNMTTHTSAPCQRGYYCPRGSIFPNGMSCPGGSYSYREHNREWTDCEVCWQGHHCPAATGSAATPAPLPCTPGFYCPGMPPPANGQLHTLKEYQGKSAGAGNMYPCPPGTYSTANDLYRPDQCTPCPKGSYCVGGLTVTSGLCNAGYYCPQNSSTATDTPCPAGTYRAATGGGQVEDCTPCTPGNYCPAASTAVTPCPAGRYNPDYSMELAGPPRADYEKTCRACPAGYYCPSASVIPLICHEGTYSDTDAAACSTCDVGRYCPFEGVSKDQMNRLYICPASLYCTVGLSRIPQTQTDACPVGHFCPAGIAAPTPCPIGTYNPNKGRGAEDQCLQCTPGFYCGETGLSNVTGECDPGHYCPLGSSKSDQVDCPPRYYRLTSRGESEDFCSVCPRGFFCNGGTSMPTPCTKGYYCVTGSEIPAPCPIGTFANVTGLRSQDECIACSPGEYCDGLGLEVPTGLCDAGYYCLSRAYTSAPPGLPTGGLCPKGGYCPPGSSFPTACAQGTYNNFTGGSTQSDCTACTPGYYCSGSNLPGPSGPCSAGYYCTGGAFLPTQFLTPIGHFTLGGSPAPEECPLGTYNPAPGQSSCLPCVEGYYCPTRAMTTFIICPPGGYCPRGSTLPTPCPVGTYQPFERRQNVSDCTACPEGEYCDARNATTPAGKCSAGYYCKRACVSSTCSLIVNNDREVVAHNPASLLSENSYGGECPVGKYCLYGVADPTPCPVGTIRDGTRGTNKAGCAPCPGGFYCPSTGMSTLLTGLQVPQLCGRGFYCPGKIPGKDAGCSTPNCDTFQSEPCGLNSIGCHGTTNEDLTFNYPVARSCPTGFYCPTGTVNPRQCQPHIDGRATFAPRREMSHCELCPPGYYCNPFDVLTLQNPLICPTGRYCPEGTSRMTMPFCPPGTFGRTLGLVNKTQCERCPAGRYCPHIGTDTRVEADHPYCYAGFFCTSGIATGFGQPGEIGGLGGPCPVGHYCPNGTKTNTSYPCPPGSYKPHLGGSTVASCIACSPGMYCQGSGNELPDGECAPGYYCPRGCVDRYCSNALAAGARPCPAKFVPFTKWHGGPCEKGHECVKGSVMPIPCRAGTFQANTHSFSCTMCTPGHYCPDGAITPLPCPEGHYCPPGTGDRDIPRCPRGTYNPLARMSNLTDCLLCPAGRFCNGRALNVTSGPCAAGFFCVAGAIDLNGTVGERGGEGGICPPGHYCPAGTRHATEFPCHPGTFQPAFYARNESLCLRCTPGFYCSSAGAHAVTGPCAPGYYCPTSCQDAQCSNQPCRDNCAHPMPYHRDRFAIGGECPPGFHCPQMFVDGGATLSGAVAPTMCPAGTYAEHAHMAVCHTCPPGRWCDVRTTQPQPCPPGHFCPNGTASPRDHACPLGTFSPASNNSHYDDCRYCAAGMYCADRGLAKPSGVCARGFFCESGASTATGIVGERGGRGGDCPIGHYCPEGTPTDKYLPCPPGTYQPFTNMANSSACIACTPGYYCPDSAMITAGPACALGYFCPRGCRDAQCSNVNTPSACGGTGNCADSDTSPYADARCPPGYYCPGHGTRGTILPVGCPAGTYSTGTAAKCTLCPPGFVCPPRTAAPVNCPTGQYCPIGTRQRGYDCPIGSYNPINRGNNLTDCLLCPPGKYCSVLGAKAPTGDCFGGYFCTGGAINGRGESGALGGYGGPCPPGHYCPAGTTSPHEFACRPGTFQPFHYASQPHTCMNCTSGYYCQGSGNANVTGPCDSGFSCLGPCDNAQCDPCPDGFFCPQITRLVPVITKLLGPTLVSGSRVPKSCPAATYTAGQGIGACITCPAGHYCPPGAISTLPRLCEAGRYCPEGTGTVQPRCPPGTYSTAVGLNSSTQCSLCPGGHFCASTGLVAPTGICAAGYYCTGGAVDAHGKLGVLGGFNDPYPRDQYGYAACPIGHYCPAGVAHPLPCPVGTIGRQIGASNETHCEWCTPGSYCELPALTQPTGPCAGGYVCGLGCKDKRCEQSLCQSSNVARGPCPVAHYCPNGTAAAIPCPSGTYSNAGGLAECLVCPIGTYCPLATSNPLPCPNGRYCPPGTRSEAIPKCPKGTYNNGTGLLNETQCTPCLPSRACTVEGLTLPDQWCTEGYFCMRGAATVRGVPGPLGGSGGICPVGHYCIAATSLPAPCPTTTYNPDLGAENITLCRTCAAGFYCPTAGAELPKSRCDAGFYCLPGSDVPRPPLTHCPTGHYCPRGAVEPFPCPAGTFQDVKNATSVANCKACPAGKYCTAGSGAPSGPCAPGYLCFGGNKHPRPLDSFCQPGYYCPAGSSAQIPCPPAHYCRRPRLGRPEGQCAPGYYCTLRATDPRPTNSSTGGICPIGHYCPANASYPVSCPAGTYNPNRFAWTAVSCLACKAGFSCPREGQSDVTDFCAAGFYCPPGQKSSQPAEFACPAGHKCLAGAKSPTVCLSGTYQDHLGQNDCKICPAGSYCMTSSLCPGANETFPRPCLRGYYCPVGSAAPRKNPCPIGRYSNLPSLKSSDECNACDPGRYCPLPGTNNVADLKCSAGFYCTGGASTPRPTDNVTGDRCTRGHYCPEGTSVPIACPKGTYSPNRGLKSESECSACPPGYYCDGVGLFSPSGPCFAGYYCAAGATTPAEAQCPYGRYCPAGTSTPKVCLSGQYARGFGSHECLPCPAGQYCDETEPCKYCNVTVPARDCFNQFTCPRTCPDGNYCPIGTKLATQLPCPAGFFGPRAGLRRFEDCEPCPTGSYCPFPGLSSVRALLCAPGYWCKNGSFTATPRDGLRGEVCPKGFYCPLGTKQPFPCPIGTYSPSVGAANISSCVPCAAGSACTHNALAAPNVNCTAGYYCPGGQATPTPYPYHCPMGFHCPTGSVGPHPCPSGAYAPTRGLAQCLACPAGKYCLQDDQCNLVNRTNPVDCPMGYYCPTGTRFATEFPCPLGTFGNDTGYSHIDNCTTCAPGQSCERQGMMDGTVPNCSRSYFCTAAASRPDPTDNVTGNVCPRGHYCPDGTGEPVPCPPGTFNNGTGLWMESQCEPCTPGFFCATAGLWWPTGQCFGGYYCPPGQSLSSPPAYRCPAGRRCPHGSPEPIHCADGTEASAATGLEACGPCPRGYFCNIAEQQQSPYFLGDEKVVAVPCPRGFTCPQGTASRFDTPCLPGTYKNATGLTHPTECNQCPAGKYCLNPGAIEPTGLCEQGYYCRSGSWSPEPNIPDVPVSKAGRCPSGHYCILGTATPIPCPVGLYYAGTGAVNASWCRPCLPGKYCSSTGNSDPNGQGLCTAGYYCPGGNSKPLDPNFICPIGHFCGAGSDSPTPCPAGTYTNTEGKASCDACPALNYCPPGTSVPIECAAGTVCPPGSPYELTCAAGLYVPENAGRMADMSECRECDAGKFCSNGTISGDCNAGHICVKGNYKPNPLASTDGRLPSGGGNKTGRVCPLGYYCPLGTTRPQPCPNNTVGLSEGLQSDSDCSPCQPGFYCVPGNIFPIQCPKGHYCPGFIGRAGGLIPCPIATYNDVVQGEDPSWCKPCEEGYYCPLEGMPASDRFPSPPGYYSTKGQHEPLPCPSGTWSDRTNGTADNVSSCEACPVGYYCGPQQSDYLNYTCPEGFVCPVGTFQPRHCPGGHYCPALADAPIPCPDGYYCDPALDSTTPGLCWPGTYCPLRTEIPLLCPFGSVGTEGITIRASVEGACVVCQPGTFSNVTVCDPCGAGHVCIGGTATEFPLRNDTEHGYICPVGHYCPAGSAIETPCPVGTFRNITKGAALEDCYLCPTDSYNGLVGQVTCQGCGASSFAEPGSANCTCSGANRVYQSGDGSCRCKPGFVFYPPDDRLSTDDGSEDCEEITYEVCRPGFVRSANGLCVEENDPAMCEHCGDNGGIVDPTTGLCLCNTLDTLDTVCDATCRANAPIMTIDMQTKELVWFDPATSTEERVPLSTSSVVGSACPTTSLTCSVRMVSLAEDGPAGVYTMDREAFLATANASTSATVNARRRRLLQSNSAGLRNPAVCLNLGETMMWDISHPSRKHYPVYDKDSLLNTNDNFDFTQFRRVAEYLKDPNYNITSFAFSFSTPGVYVFYDFTVPQTKTVVRVAEADEQCPATPFMEANSATYLSLGTTSRQRVNESPEWTLIGVLLAGMFLLLVGLVTGLWQIRRATWGMIGNQLPRYRTLAMYHLAGKAAGISSRGLVRGGQADQADAVEAEEQSRLVTLRLDTPVSEFIPAEFVASICKMLKCNDGCIMLLGISDGSTIIRFVFRACEGCEVAPQEHADELLRLIKDDTSYIHLEMPILAFDAGGDDDLSYRTHPAYAIANTRDDYWDYERNVDVGNYDVRTLYDKIEDQTIEIVREIAQQQTDDVQLLCDKILVESELLKDMFVRVKLQIDRGNAADTEVIERRTRVMQGGKVEFELDTDVKVTLKEFLRGYFDNALEQTKKSIEERKRKEIEEADRGRREQLEAVEKQLAELDKNGAAASTSHITEIKDDDDEHVTTHVGGRALNIDADFSSTMVMGQTLASTARRVAAPSAEFPAELRDDSDLDDEERTERAVRREKLLALRLQRARRVADTVTMPFGLDDVPASTGIRSVEESLAIGKQRNEWKAVRKAERAEHDNTATESLTNLRSSARSPKDALDKSKRNADKLYRRLRILRDALTAVEVPNSLRDDESLAANDRAARAEKRGRFLQQKLHKVRQARADAAVPLELDADSDTESREVVRRADAADDFARKALEKLTQEPNLPSADVSGLSLEQRQARRGAVDKAINHRIAVAASVPDLLGMPEGLSDHSDLDDRERQQRRATRGHMGVSIASPAASSASQSPAKVVRRGAGAKAKVGGVAGTDSTVTLKRTDFAGLLAVKRNGPEEYADDEDLDDEERMARHELRNAFKRGKAAAMDAPPPHDDKARGLNPQEQRRREGLNEAFMRGKEAHYGADPIALQQMAEEVSRIATTASGTSAKFVELGRKQARLSQMPEEYADSNKMELRNAFVDGKRATAIAAPLAPLESEDAKKIFDAACYAAVDVSDPGYPALLERLGFQLGRASERSRVMDAAMEAETQHGNAHTAAKMRDAHARGRTAGASLEIPDELKSADAKRAFVLAVNGADIATAANGRGSEAEKAARLGAEKRAAAMELAEFHRDDVPLLDDSEVADRRACRAAFLVGLQGKTADAIMAYIERDEALSSGDRNAMLSAFADAKKAQKAADAIPSAIEGDEVKSAAHLRGRAAGHMQDAFSTVSPALPNAAALRAAKAKGAKAQRALMEMPAELIDEPGLAPHEAKTRAANRAALNAGRNAMIADNLPAELDVAAAAATPIDISELDSAKHHELNVSASPAGLQPSASKAVIKGELAAAGVVDDSSAKEALKAVKKEYQTAFKSLKAKHQIEQSQALEELEDELISEAKTLDRELDDQFTREKKRMGDKHHLEQLNADPHKLEGLKARHQAQMQNLEKSQDEARRGAHNVLVKRGDERKAKLRTVLEAKALNELRLQKTISADQEKEIVRLQQQAQADATKGDMARDEELKLQKQRLLEKIHAREKRLKVKASKEKEFLNTEIREIAALRVEGAEVLIKDREAVLQARSEELAQRGLIETSELAEENDRMQHDLLAEKERRVAAIRSDAETDRLERERALTERHAKRTQTLIQASQAEVEELLEQQKELETTQSKAAAPDAEATATLIAKQEAQRRELAKQLDAARREEAAKMGAAGVEEETAARAEADKKIAAREKERGQRMSEEQKQQIMDECRRDAARMRDAVSDEQRAQMASAKKALEDRRRKKEMELHKAQLAEQQRELKRQEEAAAKRTAELKGKVKAVVAVAKASPAATSAEEKEKAAKLAELRKAHEEEVNDFKSKLTDNAEREEAQLRAENERRLAELKARQAKEAANAREEERAGVIARHEAEAAEIAKTLGADAASQQAKLQEQLAARRARKEKELRRRQEGEERALRQREEDAAAAALKAEQLKAESDAVKSTLESGSVAADKAADVAQVIMQERHAAEAKRLVERQAERRKAEKARLADMREEKLAGAFVTGTALKAFTQELDDDIAATIEQLEADLTEEQLRLKLDQWNEVSQAAGMASPEEVLRRHRAKVNKQSNASADDELTKFKQAKQAEQEALQARMAKEQADYDAKLQAEMAARREALDKELAEKEAAISKRLEAEKAKREKYMLDANKNSSSSADNHAKIKERLIAEGRRDEERLKDNLAKERERQQSEVEERLAKRRARDAKKREAVEKLRQGGTTTEESASSANGTTTTTNADGTTTTTTTTTTTSSSSKATTNAALKPQLEALRDSLMARGPGAAGVTTISGAGPAGIPAAGLDAWAHNMVQQIESAHILDRVSRIERRVEESARDGLLYYYVDERDRQVGKCEGTLKAVEPSELSSAEFVVYFFANALRENLTRTGVNLPGVRLAVADALPQPQAGMSAFRNSYHYDGRTLYIRRSRLAAIGEFAVVMLHALAHIKVTKEPTQWDDSNPAFTKEFYGLLELTSEEMFFARLPAVKATRDVQPGRGYRPDAIMTTKSLAEIENSLRRVSKAERDAFLRTYLQM